ncbi:MAG TPA: TlpA disulfide reductase family protein, partial [Dehalococcoidia bacterium]
MRPAGLTPSGAAIRLAAGSAIIAVVLALLWQFAGLFGGSGSSGSSAGEPANLQPVSTSVQTPNPLGLTVGLKPGNVAPDFEFSDYTGRRFRLSDFRGHPVVLNFWASWCAPCKQELPAMSAVLRAYEGRLSVIGVNNGESYQTGKRFLDQVKADLTSYAYDPAQAVANKYAIAGMPTSFFIDADGVVTRVMQGP